jgi:hypothetical protein
MEALFVKQRAHVETASPAFVQVEVTVGADSAQLGALVS